MELYRKVRLACRDGMSERAAARHFGVSRQSVRKMLEFSVPPGYRRTAPVRRPKLDEFTALIEQWLEDDRRHGYLTHRLRLAGCEIPLFEPPAIKALFQSARGLPRLINRIAHYALTAAAVNDARTVNAGHLEHAVAELRL